MSRSKTGKRNALGRGLGALIPDAPKVSDEPAPSGDGAVRSALKKVAIERLRPGAAQPRKRFEEAGLLELAASIERHGVLQPVVVSPLASHPGHYEIIAGERRWRAAQRAGLHEVPVIVRDTPEAEALEIALVENLHRIDLSPIEEAHAYKTILEVNGFTQEQLADRVGRDRSTVANTLRLLRLPEKVQELVNEGHLSMGHARALLSLENPADISSLASEAARRSMSVRAVEAEVRRRHRAALEKDEPEDDDAKRHAIIVRDLENRLAGALGAKVKLKTGRKRRGPGKVEIPYQDLDDLNRILHVLLGHGGQN